MWYYVGHVWSVGQPANFSDLYARWWGAHELWLHQRDPYGPEVTREIQIVIYGAPVESLHSGDAAELAGGFAYPIYVAFLLWPTIHMPFPVVQKLFYCLLVAGTLGCLVLSLYALRWRPPVAVVGTIVCFTFGSFPVLQGIKLQNLSLLVAFLVAAALASLAADHLAIAGLFLAFATIKPQFVALLIPWLTLWALSDWKRRQLLIWSFSALMSAFILGGEMIAPGWVSRFLAVVRAYRQYTYGHSLLDVWLTPRIGLIAALVLVLALLTLCWRWRFEPARSSRFFLTCCLILAATLVVIPTLEPHAQLLLLPGFLFLLRHRRGIWRSGKNARLLFAAPWILLGWAWVAALSMWLAAILTPAGRLRAFWALPLYTSPLLPLAVGFILGFLLRNENSSSAARGMILES